MAQMIDFFHKDRHNIEERKRLVNHKGGCMGPTFLLTKDVILAQRMTGYLKEYNVRPYFFNELRKLWDILLESRPNLLLIDIGFGKEEGLDLSTHPLIISGEIHIGLIVDSDKPSSLLLKDFSTLSHDGMIFIGPNEKLLLQQTIARINRFSLLEQQKGSYERQWNAQKAELERTIQKYNRDYEKNQVLMRWMHKVESLRFSDLQEDFIAQLGHFFNYWESFVERFSFYCLSPSLDQLQSPVLDLARYVQLPEHWTTEKMLRGIDFADKNMALEKAMDSLSERTLMLALKKKDYKADFLIFIKPYGDTGEIIKNINWGFFEEVLCQYWHRYCLENESNMTQRYPIITTWELLGPMYDEEILLPEQRGDAHFIIHFNDLMTILFSPSIYNVQWKAMMEHFNEHILKVIPNLKHLCFIQSTRIVYTVDRKKSSMLFGVQFYQDILYEAAIKIKQFSFLKYFDLARKTPMAIEQLEIYYPKIQYLDKPLEQIQSFIQGGHTNERISPKRSLAYSQDSRA